MPIRRLVFPGADERALSHLCCELLMHATGQAALHGQYSDKATVVIFNVVSLSNSALSGVTSMHFIASRLTRGINYCVHTYDQCRVI